MNRRLRIYFDTSVLGGCFDDEFSYESRKLLDEVKARRYNLILSSTSLLELSQAPKQVRDLLKSLPEESIEIGFFAVLCGLITTDRSHAAFTIALGNNP